MVLNVHGMKLEKFLFATICTLHHGTHLFNKHTNAITNTLGNFTQRRGDEEKTDETVEISY